MATVNAASLRKKFEAAKAQIAALRAAGKISKEVDDVIRVLSTLASILITVLLEKTTRKTGANSGLLPSQTDKDERRKGARANLADGRQPPEDRRRGDGHRRGL